ncbi:MAG TPA: GNAT family N-acetyltransferase [Gaiellaceae bacterium]|nr:GNAT family N-acetyltransferase [Gaiellaceae bacterium]
MSGKLLSTGLCEPRSEEILAFCARDPIERVFLEDVARRGHGRFLALREDDALQALCHLGTNVVPSGRGCGAFSGAVAKAGPRMLIGEERAVSELWEAARRKLPRAREDRPGQPVYAMWSAPEPGGTGLRPATLDDLDLLVPACAASHLEELGVDPLRRDPEGFRWRTRAQIEEGRSWIWEQEGVILFKAEASAWTPSAVQLQQVWVDPPVRRRGFAGRALRDLILLLLERTPAVTLFVRRDNVPAIRLYESIGMERVLSYRSVLL